ncbi:MAG: YdcF family protein [Lewinellaceae bacterium]|nr:YdcF family protein [Saprospiraceae bacterium]MCB9314086.1 YdcF family protein [Lewinellaceae bacterium]
MRFLLNLIIDPVFLWLLVMAAGGIQWLRHRKTPARRWFWAGGLWLLLIGATPLSTWLAADLEYRYPVLDLNRIVLDSSRTTHVVVLGGGASPGKGLLAFDQLSGDALSRIVEGVRIMNRLDEANLVTTGALLQGERSQADLLASTGIDLGVSLSDTLMLPDPRTTREEARAYQSRFGKSNQVILVTSAIHLPRAMGWFRYQGLDPIPAPANHLVKISPHRWTYDWWPSPQKITRMRRVCHEYAGLTELAWVSRK